ncbi:hypothetical protein I316_08036 [Kwoniella heveanensis BCC8398]|uniref:Uncharacterized protein n=1 Tax=Kwoniella heveanensis BCC8398 TaxID=1296120 RepID=A0A1B9GH12_9TREE|nr:hypothetical protein I316_08036 [Kwoniella heveanensis BCC8398]
MHMLFTNLPLDRQLFLDLLNCPLVDDVYCDPPLPARHGGIRSYASTISFRLSCHPGTVSEQTQQRYLFEQFRDSSQPLFWYFRLHRCPGVPNDQINILPAGPQAFSDADKREIFEHVDQWALLPSAEILREVIRLGDWNWLAVHMADWNAAFRMSAMHGRLDFFCPLSGFIPTACRLLNNGLVQIVHDRIRGLGPWVVCIANQLRQDIVAEINRAIAPFGCSPMHQRRLGPRITLPAAHAKLRTSHHTIQVIGRFGDGLRGMLDEAILRQRESAPQYTVPLGPLVPQVQPIPVLPHMAKWILKARVVESDRANAPSLAFRQIATMLRTPPPSIQIDFANVGEIIVHFERNQGWIVPLMNRRWMRDVSDPNHEAFIDPLAPDIVVSGTSLDVITRMYSDLGSVRAQLPGLTVMNSGALLRTGEGEGASERTDEEDFRLAFGTSLADEEGLGDVSPASLEWVAVGGAGAGARDEFGTYLKQKEALSNEERYHRLTSQFIIAHTFDTADENDPRLPFLNQVKDAIREYLHGHDLRSVVTVSRTSQAAKGVERLYQTSVKRQIRFIEQFLPDGIVRHSVPLDGLSISRDGLRIRDALRQHSRSLIVVCTVDRLVRTEQLLDELESLLRDTSQHVLALILPPSSIAQIAPSENNFFTRALRAEFEGTSLYDTACHASSTPSLYPTIIAGLNSPPVVRAVGRPFAADTSNRCCLVYE